jgi:hypothetical protein
LCSVPIEKGSTYLTWAWLDPNGEIARIKAHPGCNAYAVDTLRDQWCYGDGLDPGAVEADLRDRLLRMETAEVVGVDRVAETLLREEWPDLEALIDAVVESIVSEYEDENEVIKPCPPN